MRLEELIKLSEEQELARLTNTRPTRENEKDDEIDLALLARTYMRPDGHLGCVEEY